jgi:hypothetical protein
MGDKPLMHNIFKKISMVLFLLSSSLWSGSVSSEEITNMISKIKEERVGIGLSKLENTLNPFIIHKKPEVEKVAEQKVAIKVPKEVVYKLNGIMNNAVFINNKWYKKGDKLGLYRVGHIGHKSVTLMSKSGNKTLSMKKRKKKVIKLNQGKR